MANCEHCGAPVTLAPDGDPRYQKPPLMTVEILEQRVAKLERIAHMPVDVEAVVQRILSTGISGESNER